MSQVSEMNAGGWSIEQLMTLQERFGKAVFKNGGGGVLS